MSFLTLVSLSGQQATPAGQGNMLVGLLPFILVFVIFYLLIIMPQRKKQKQHQQMVANLKPGDRVITSGGIFGTVMDVHPDRIELKIAANVCQGGHPEKCRSHHPDRQGKNRGQRIQLIVSNQIQKRD